MLMSNIIFTFDSKIDSKTKLERIISKAYRANKTFFGKNPLKIEISFLYTRSQMDRTYKQKTAEWIVGYTNKNHFFIFSPKVFDQVSPHPASDFSYVLVHEMAHVFTNEILGLYYPIWLYEGIAGYVAKQYEIRKIKQFQFNDFNQLHDTRSWNKFNNYPQAYSMAKYLIDKFGKKKMLEFLGKTPKALGRHHYPDKFIQFFSEFFNNDFSTLVSAWQMTLK